MFPVEAPTGDPRPRPSQTYDLATSSVPKYVLSFRSSVTGLSSFWRGSRVADQVSFRVSRLRVPEYYVKTLWGRDSRHNRFKIPFRLVVRVLQKNLFPYLFSSLVGRNRVTCLNETRECHLRKRNPGGTKKCGRLTSVTNKGSNTIYYPFSRDLLLRPRVICHPSSPPFLLPPFISLLIWSYYKRKGHPFLDFINVENKSRKNKKCEVRTTTFPYSML